MKVEKITVTRSVEIPGQKDLLDRKTTVSFRQAESAEDMLNLCGGKIEQALEYFNGGRWSELRTQVSNALAGKSTEQKAVDKMIAAFRSINPSLTEEAARTMVLSMPNMEAATKVASDILPEEIDDTYFVAKKAEKKAAKTEEPVSA